MQDADYEAYEAGFVKGIADSRNCRPRYYLAESDNAEYICGYDDGYDTVITVTTETERTA